ncbi:hypothetical protein P6F26_18905 [Roseibacterium sp. SDUM158017]|uniref:hypothetical protein n=1 Tax=Roseicyclus salinarum TaxID=3036773 RepID=UPI00241541E4|nr:hypothetical protein [Roseibacterium sp. SDUM158017]MDG4650519.1 hypothetical protein [Roseibacterium sp. SDUM158017]
MTAVDPQAPRPADIAVRRVSWGAIFVGTVVALALMVFFTTLGIAIGAAAVDPLYDDAPLSGMGVGSGLYMILTQLISLAVGGFAAAKLAGVPRLPSSILHGAAVWALSTVLLAWAAIAGGGAMFGAASTMIGNSARAAANVAEAVAPDDFSFPDIGEMASEISVENLPPEIRTTLEENGITVDQLRRETRQAFENVVSQQEQDRAMSILRNALADALQSPGNVGQEVNDAVDALVSGPEAVFSEEDREEVLRVLQQRLGLTEAEVEQLVVAVETRFESAVDQMQQTLDEARQQALEAAQTASSVLSTTAWYLTLASLLGLVAAAGGAFAGKPDGFLGDRLDDRL